MPGDPVRAVCEPRTGEPVGRVASPLPETPALPQCPDNKGHPDGNGLMRRVTGFFLAGGVTPGVAEAPPSLAAVGGGST